MSSSQSAQSQNPHGLTSSEVRIRLKKYGKNQIVPSGLRTRIAEIFEFFKDPMALMMLGLSLIYFLMGEKVDAIIMLIAFIPISGVDVFLKLRADKALGALKSTFNPVALVFRDGKLKEVSILEIVPGDQIALEEGQTVPADGFVVSCAGLSVNEAALTGESIPVDKNVSDLLYTGTTVLIGRGVYEVVSTGKNTKFGKVVELLGSTQEEESPLQKKINNLVLQVIKVAVVLVIGLFILELTREKTFLEALLVALTFGMASVPEEFPLVFTLYLSLGAWRLSRSGVLVKSLPSVETLGRVDVICTDKTGTLTEGIFQLNEIIPFCDMSLSDRLKFATLACEPIAVDSMELAIRKKVPSSFDLHNWTLVHDYPFEIEGKHMTHGWVHQSGETLLTMKGAVEGVLYHCSDDQETKDQIIKKTEELSSQGYRLLGLAGKNAPITGAREEDEAGVSFIGIMAFSDPIRSSAKIAIETCQNEGIIVKMITGDHPLTAHAIADELELNHSHDALYTGIDLQNLSHEDRLEAFRKGAIFSRVTPEQKYELVKALKADGLVVAMTGDGINDTPAMKIADIGISMGENATDAARATAKMVLTKNDFNGIVQAIIEGRKIFANLRKSFSYLISFHVPVVLLAFLPPFFKMGEMILPIHIILLELIVHPVSAFTFENLESSSKKSTDGLINKKTVFSAIMAGVIVSLMALVIFFVLRESSDEERRTMALTTVLFGNIGFVLLETWPLFNKRLGVTVVTLIGVTLLVSVSSTISSYLHLTILPVKWYFYSLGMGLAAAIPSWLIRRKH